MAGRSVHGLTVVISPLQSLMKDQVDNLAERGITEAVTINGMLDPITRALAIEKVQDGTAALLYISPEMLRSATIERILLTRNVVRFVIDEAHCFSSWGRISGSTTSISATSSANTSRKRVANFQSRSPVSPPRPNRR